MPHSTPEAAPQAGLQKHVHPCARLRHVLPPQSGRAHLHHLGGRHIQALGRSPGGARRHRRSILAAAVEVEAEQLRAGVGAAYKLGSAAQARQTRLARERKIPGSSREQHMQQRTSTQPTVAQSRQQTATAAPEGRHEPQERVVSRLLRERIQDHAAKQEWRGRCATPCVEKQLKMEAVAPSQLPAQLHCQLVQEPGKLSPNSTPEAAVGIQVKVADERRHLRQLAGGRWGRSPG